MKIQPRPARNALSKALLPILFAPLAALAQTAPQTTQEQAEQPAPQTGAKQLDKVTVTGSRIKRAEVEGPAPLTLITGEQIKKEGFVTVYDALTTLNEAIGTVEADVQWGSHTPNASPLNLRNMGPGRSLLLVNGRRVADYPLPCLTAARAISPTTAIFRPRQWSASKCSPAALRRSTVRMRSPAWSM